MPTRPPRLRLRTSLPGALLLAAALAPAPGAAQVPAPTCDAPEHRHFDFWIGEWEVYRGDGQRAGTNTIRPAMNGCVLHESWDGSGGFHGESFNIWDRGRGVWHQTWVDTTGLLLRLEGGLVDGAMRLEGETVGPGGGRILHRITWSVVDGDPDRVRQLWQRSMDGGETWEVSWDGDYRRIEG